jgi:hypothetical protein
MPIQWDQGGRPFATLDDFEGSKDLTVDWIKNDPAGKDFAAKYASPSNVDRLAEVLELHGMVVSSQNLSWVFFRLRDSGQLTVPQAAVEPDVPRDRHGRALSAAQIAWGEMVRWSDSASSKQIEERRQTDPAYRQFFLTNLKNEMNQPIDGAAIEPTLGPAPYVDEAERKRLIQFARDFNTLSTRDAKNKFLVVYNPDCKTFSKDFDQCCKLRLL